MLATIVLFILRVACVGSKGFFGPAPKPNPTRRMPRCTKLPITQNRDELQQISKMEKESSWTKRCKKQKTSPGVPLLY
jgi:hypothetical protein